MNLKVSQIKYGQIKTVNFTTDQLNHGQKKGSIETCSTNNEGKSVVAERFIRTLRTKVYNHMTSMSKNV